MELTRIIINDNNEQQIIFLKEVDGDRTLEMRDGLLGENAVQPPGDRIQQAPR